MSEIQRLVAEINAAGYQVFQLFQCENALHHWGCMAVSIGEHSVDQIVVVNRTSPEAALKAVLANMDEDNLEDYL